MPLPIRRVIQRIIGYVWAAPVTALALLFVPLAWLSGGGARVVRGAVEVHGGFVSVLLRRGLLFFGPAAAMTLGHVILGRDRVCLDRSREHEHVHVGQYERWGIFMLPVYLLASGILYLKGLDPYLDNPFEREAYDKTRWDD
jgi:hypothetical protein